MCVHFFFFPFLLVWKLKNLFSVILIITLAVLTGTQDTGSQQLPLEGWGAWRSSCPTGWRGSWYSHFGKVRQDTAKLNVCLACDSALSQLCVLVALLNVYAKNVHSSIVAILQLSGTTHIFISSTMN